MILGQGELSLLANGLPELRSASYVTWLIPTDPNWRGAIALPAVGEEPVDGVYVSVPLWLLALLCLAWPVTSFIIHRRRHKRGFPVEPKGAGDSVNTSAS